MVEGKKVVKRNQIWAGEGRKSGENIPSVEELLLVKNVNRLLMTASVCLTPTWKHELKTALEACTWGFEGMKEFWPLSHYCA